LLCAGVGQAIGDLILTGRTEMTIEPLHE
jgi:hypothetical protein